MHDSTPDAHEQGLADASHVDNAARVDDPTDDAAAEQQAEPQPLYRNVFGREYTPAEFAAARRLGIVGPGLLAESGPLIYAGGPYLPNDLRQKANDYALLADAVDREWARS